MTERTNIENSNQENFNATLTTNSGEGVTKNTEVKVNVDKQKPANRKIVIEKQVNVVHKEAPNVKGYQLELVHEIYKNCSMALSSIEAIQPEICSGELKQVISSQYAGYKNIYTRTIDYMLENAIEPEKPGKITKALRKTAVKFNAFTVRDDSHIAEMMINGSTMGIISITKSINSLSVKKNEMPKPLADELLTFLRASIDNLYKFLK